MSKVKCVAILNTMDPPIIRFSNSGVFSSTRADDMRKNEMQEMVMKKKMGALIVCDTNGGRKSPFFGYISLGGKTKSVCKIEGG